MTATKSRTPRITPEVRQVLTRARKLIQRQWVKGRYVQVDRSEGFSEAIEQAGDDFALPAKYIKGVCAIGGVQRAVWLELGKPKYTGHGVSGFGEEFDRLERKATQRLLWAVNKVRRYETEDGTFDWSWVPSFNDENRTTKEEVLQAFDIAIGGARK